MAALSHCAACPEVMFQLQGAAFAEALLEWERKELILLQLIEIQ
jgi:hypothetical protein